MNRLGDEYEFASSGWFDLEGRGQAEEISKELQA